MLDDRVLNAQIMIRYGMARHVRIRDVMVRHVMARHVRMRDVRMRGVRMYHITNSLYDNVMSARIAARDLAAMLWMPHVMSRLCMLHVMLMLWMRLLGLRVRWIIEHLSFDASPATRCATRLKDRL